MGVIYLYRIGTFVLALILAIVVTALSGQTTSAIGKVTPGFDFKSLKQSHVDVGDFAYAKFGLFTGALTLIALPIIVVMDFLTLGSIRLTALVEVVVLTVIGLLWIITAVLTLNEADWTQISCKVFKPFDGALVTICNNSQPIEIVSFIVAGLVLLYCVAVAGYSFLKGRNGTPIWGEPVKDIEKS